MHVLRDGNQVAGGGRTHAVSDAFASAFHIGRLVATAACVGGAIAATALPGKRRPAPRAHTTVDRDRDTNAAG